MAGRGASGGIGPRRSVALLGSAIFHIAMLLLLARYLAQTASYGEAPAMKVSLVPPPPRPEAGERKVDATATRARPDRLRLLDPTVPGRLAPQPDGGAAPLPLGPATAGADELAGSARRGLRGLGGCERADLTRDERERCEARRWAGAEPVARRLNLDPSGRYAVNPEAFLSRRPKKGCRLRVTGDVDVMGDDQNARGGITCVKPF